MNSPHVSIIIPCYNAERYIGDTIESALSQECLVQVIVVDDGSTDDSVRHVRRYEPAVELIRTENRGIAAARNAALELVRAPHFLLLDHDDRLAEHALRRLLTAADQSERRVVYGQFQGWNQDMTRRLAVPELQLLAPTPFEFLSRQDFTPPGAVLFPTGAISRIGEFDQSVAGCDDWDFLMRLARAGDEFVGIRQVVFHYRRLSSSASNQPIRMLRAGVEVIRRAHAPDERINDDQFPLGLASDEMEQKQLLWAADCFALAAVRGNQDEMQEVFDHFPRPHDPDWKSFACTFRKMLAWHTQPYCDDRESPFRDGLVEGSRFLADNVAEFQRGSEPFRCLVYPNFAELVAHPGPRKAIRLLKEWFEARSVVAALGHVNS